MTRRIATKNMERNPEDARKTRKKMSKVWEHFKMKKNTVQCIHCGSELVYHRSTTSMMQHLQRKHPDCINLQSKGDTRFPAQMSVCLDGPEVFTYHEGNDSSETCISFMKAEKRALEAKTEFLSRQLTSAHQDCQRLKEEVAQLRMDNHILKAECREKEQLVVRLREDLKSSENVTHWLGRKLYGDHKHRLASQSPSPPTGASEGSSVAIEALRHDEQSLALDVDKRSDFGAGGDDKCFKREEDSHPLSSGLPSPVLSQRFLQASSGAS